MSMNKEVLLTRDFLIDDSDDNDDMNMPYHSIDHNDILTVDKSILNGTSNLVTLSAAEILPSSGTISGLSDCGNCTYTCPYVPCKSVHFSEIEISRHILQCHIMKVFACSKCARLFPCQEDAANHENRCILLGHPHVDWEENRREYNTLNLIHSESLSNENNLEHEETTTDYEVSTAKHETIHQNKFTAGSNEETFCAESNEQNRDDKCDEQFGNACMHQRDPNRVQFGDNKFVTSNGKSSADSPTSFPCPHCQCAYSHRQTLRVHVFKKHFDYLHDCLYYKSPTTGKCLYLTQTDAQRYRCAHCLIPFARKSHKLKHNMDICRKKNIHQCVRCLRRFSSLELLNTHNLSQPCSELSNDDAWSCHLCTSRFNTRNQLMQHERTHSKPYKCMEKSCNKNFAKKSQLTLHKLRHSDEKPEKCDVCNARFRYKIQLKQHSLSHLSSAVRSKLFRCLYCDKHYKFLCTLKSHVFQVHCDTNTRFLYFRYPNTNKEYYLMSCSTNIRCRECNKRFPSLTKLKRHSEEKHESGSRKYACMECNVAFSSSWKLTQHMRTKIHNPNRNYTCQACNKQFHTKAALSSHKTVHSTEKAFQCSVCGKTFARKTQLQRHSLTHSGIKSHPCPVCGKTFSVVYDMKRHMNVHKANRVKAYNCIHCEKGYDKKAQFIKHCETRHSCMLASSQ